MRAYLINLDRSPDRLAAAAARLCAAGLPYVRVAGVDGRAMSREERRRSVRPWRFFLVHGRFPTPGECGCSLSHNALFRRMLEDGAPAAIAFEDDVDPDPEALRAALAQIEARLDPAAPDIFLLSNHDCQPTPPGGAGILPASPEALFSEAYVLTAAAARRLLFLNSPMRAAIDAWAHWAGRGVNVWRVFPASCRQAEGESVIHGGLWRPKRRSAWGWYRALWRLRIRLGRAFDALLYRLLGR